MDEEREKTRRESAKYWLGRMSASGGEEVGWEARNSGATEETEAGEEGDEETKRERVHEAGRIIIEDAG